MTPDRWQLIKELFAAALELDEATRTTWLDDHCRDDVALRAEVDSLLEAHASPAADPLDAPAKDRAGLGRLNLVELLKEQQALLVLRKHVPSLTQDDE